MRGKYLLLKFIRSTLESSLQIKLSHSSFAQATLQRNIWSHGKKLLYRNASREWFNFLILAVWDANASSLLSSRSFERSSSSCSFTRIAREFEIGKIRKGKSTFTREDSRSRVNECVSSLFLCEPSHSQREKAREEICEYLLCSVLLNNTAEWKREINIGEILRNGIGNIYSIGVMIFGLRTKLTINFVYFE